MKNTETITGGTGDDSITLGTTQTSGTIDLVSGTDTLNLAAGANTLSISNVDTVNGTASNDTLTLSAAFTGGTIDLAGGTTDVLNLGNFTNTLTVKNTETINGGTGSDNITSDGTASVITGKAGADTITGGGGSDTFNFASGDSVLSITGANGTIGSISGYDIITDLTPGTSVASSEKIGFLGAAVASFSTTNDSTLFLNTNSTVKSHAISGGLITFDDANTFSIAVNLTTNGDIAAVVQYLQNNDIGSSGTSVAFNATIGGKFHTFIFIQATDDGATNSQDVLIDLQDVSATSISAASNQLSIIDNTAPSVTVTSTSLANPIGSTSTVTFQFSEGITGFDNLSTDTTATKGTLSNLVSVDADTYTATFTRTATGSVSVSVVASSYSDNAGNLGAAGSSGNFPAGISGESVNLGLSSYDLNTPATVTLSDVPDGWTLSGGTYESTGTWTVSSADLYSLSITTDPNFIGAMLLNVTMSWVGLDGTSVTKSVTTNVEAYAPGSPIFAWSGDDTLTGSSGRDLFVFSQPIGHDTVYSFDVTSDQIDLIGYSGISSFADIQARTTEDASDNALITLADGQNITLKGVHAADLTAANFVFDMTPHTDNPGTMSIGNGAMLPLSGDINNTGIIELNSSGDHTLLQLIQHGITLTGGGQVVLSDSSENVISGTVSDVDLINVDNIISGAGQLGAGQLVLDNQSTIIATGTNALVIDTGSNVIINSGTLEATGSGGLVISSTVDNSGLLWAHGGNITANGAVNGGTALLDGQAVFEFGAAVSANVTLDADATGKIVLNDSFDFSGTLSGFNGDDLLDLRDIAFGASTSASYVGNQNGTGGVLSVTDGSHTANITLLGQYSADGFSVSADDHVGSLLVYRDHLI